MYLLWGRPAQSKIPMLTNPKHLILKAPHPSPLSAYRGFFGSKPFSQTNEFLKANITIGDKLLDTQAGKNYGVTSILVGTGYGKELYEASRAKKDEAPSYDYYAENLPQAADWILRRQ